jgi:hypothetical protein
MNPKVHKASFTSKLLCLLLFPTVVLIFGQTQTAISASSGTKKADKKGKGLKLDLYADAGFEYNDNIFRLTETQISSLIANDAEDAVSGRFEGMKSVSDFIIEPTLGMRINAKSPLGGKLGLTSWVRYNRYTQNREASYYEGRIKLRNTIGKNGAVSLQGAFLTGFYRKNYLSAVKDANRNGNITKEERTYSPAFYNEYEGLMEYEHNILKNKERTISKLDIRPFIGYHNRSYNTEFHNRDQNIPIAGMGLRFEFSSKVSLDAIYLHEWVSSPNRSEVVLFDETIASVDVNNDGRIKQNAPLSTKIDRSCRRHTIEIGPSWEVMRNITAYAGYERRSTNYITENSLDWEHFNVDAFRRKISAGIRYSIAKAWIAEVEYSRIDDDNDEDGRYAQNLVMATIRYKFN